MKDERTMAERFPVATGVGTESRSLNSFNERHDPDNVAFRNFNIVTIGLIIFAACVLACSTWILVDENWLTIRKAVYWINDQSWQLNVIGIIFSVACVVSLRLFWLGKRVKK